MNFVGTRVSTVDRNKTSKEYISEVWAHHRFTYFSFQNYLVEVLLLLNFQ